MQQLDGSNALHLETQHGAGVFSTGLATTGRSSCISKSDRTDLLSGPRKVTCVRGDLGSRGGVLSPILKRLAFLRNAKSITVNACFGVGIVEDTANALKCPPQITHI
jgi:hypothetical protein